MRRNWGFLPAHVSFRSNTEGGKRLVDGKSSFSQALEVITDTGRVKNR
jgi:hypothetical protein